MNRPELSIVVPVYNEADNMSSFYAALEPVVNETSGGSYEIIYVDDGSADATTAKVAELRTTNAQVKLVSLSRNFGKEIAMAAGIAEAQGAAIMTIDGDGQHPVDRIPDFVAAWHDGAQVVIGVRIAHSHKGLAKKYGSKLFYALMNRGLGVKMVAGATDFRLIDREVQQEFVKMYEPNRMTRALIDWLGYQRAYVKYHENPRTVGVAAYTFSSLVKLAANSFVSLSPMPLYAFGYLGLFITGASGALGISVLIEQIILNDPWHWHFTGTAMLSILVLFLVGMLLVSQGALALYISHIHAQTKRRPLYVINKRTSLGIVDKNE